MIPVYIPNIPLQILIRQWFVRNAQQRCEDWFRAHTGKKYILLTGSCRSALYLAHVASGCKGEVITSPMTCTSALDPIIATGLTIRFCDIDSGTLLMNIEEVEKQITSSTASIQAIHHGGLMLDMARLHTIARRHRLLLIEDCGQAFGALYGEVSAGRTGDVSCFSLIKNGYGIGGGVMATDDPEIYRKALEIQKGWLRPSALLLIFRILRTLFENQRHLRPFNDAYRFLMRIRPERVLDSDPSGGMDKTFRQPFPLFFRLFMLQSKRFPALREARQRHASEIVSRLSALGIIPVSDATGRCTPSYDKLFGVLSFGDIGSVIPGLHRLGIEVRHLESKFGSIRQPKPDELARFSTAQGLSSCTQYARIHERVIQLPLHEKLRPKDYITISNAFKKILHETHHH
jgi:dTDP-4-amino-4,6-dideoxygalactose transaminase